MAFIGLLVFMVLTFVRPQDFVLGVKGWPLVDIVMVPIVIGCAFRLFGSRKNNFFKTQQNFLMFVFWIVIVLSTLSVNWLGYTFNTFIEWGKYVLIYFLVIVSIDSRDKFRVLIWTIVLCAGCMSLLGILQYLGHDVTGLGVRELGRIRGVGIFDTNQLAYALGFIIPLIAALFIISKAFIVKLFLSIIFCASYYTIYLTDSRGGILCSIIVLLMILSSFTKKKSVRFSGAIIAGVVFLTALNFSSRLETVSEYQSDGSSMGRLNAWGAGLMTLKMNPFGVGKGTFSDHMGIAAHSSYIEAVTELGVHGLFVWLAFFYVSLKNLRYITQNLQISAFKNEVIIAKAFQFSLYAYLIGSFFSTNTYYITLFILFAMIVALQNIVNFKNIPFSVKDVLSIFGIETAILLSIHVFT